MHTPKQFTRKFDARASKKIFVGYTEESTNYQVYDPENKKVSVVRNVVFNEKIGAPSAETEEKEKEIEITLPLPEAECEQKNKERETKTGTRSTTKKTSATSVNEKKKRSTDERTSLTVKVKEFYEIAREFKLRAGTGTT